MGESTRGSAHEIVYLRHPSVLNRKTTDKFGFQDFSFGILDFGTSIQLPGYVFTKTMISGLDSGLGLRSRLRFRTISRSRMISYVSILTGPDM